MNDQTEAQAALTEAERVGRTVREHSRWYVRYLITFGVATIVAVSVLYWIEGSTAATLWAAGWALFVAAISRYAARQPVQGRGLRRQHLTILGACIGLYAVMLCTGLVWFDDAWWWWPLAGVVVSIPAFAGAYWLSRR